MHSTFKLTPKTEHSPQQYKPHRWTTPLLSTMPLWSDGRYVDDNEIVLSLKKMDTDLKWPALLEGWASLTTGVSELMKGTSVYVIGSSITINWAVAKELLA